MLARFARLGSQSHPRLKKILDPPMVFAAERRVAVACCGAVAAGHWLLSIMIYPHGDQQQTHRTPLLRPSAGANGLSTVI